MSCITHHLSHVMCQVSCVMFHVSCVIFTKWGSKSLEGLLSTGPTPSSFEHVTVVLTAPAGVSLIIFLRFSALDCKIATGKFVTNEATPSSINVNQMKRTGARAA